MDSDDHGQTDRLYQRIDGRGQKDSLTPQETPLAKHAEVGDVFDDIQHRGDFEESASHWSSPSFLYGRRKGTRPSV
jgi:hypothetical protein